MATGTIIPTTFEGLINNLVGVIAALGGVLFLYLVFNVINFYVNRRRLKELAKMNRKLDIILSVIGKEKRFRK